MKKKSKLFFDFAETLAEELKDSGRWGTAANYTSAVKSLQNFCGNHRLKFSDMTASFLQKYEAYLWERGLVRNTMSFYMRTLRSIYNQGIENGEHKNRHPFKRVYVGIDRTRKRAISEKELRRLQNLKLLPYGRLDFARDMFLFSFYTRGMSFVDMVHLKKQNLKGCTLVYSRRKTGRVVFVKWERCMQEIVDKYHARSHAPFLLPFFKQAKPRRADYKRCQAYINRDLKTVATLAKVRNPLTLYVARHSWASLAREKDIPIHVISDALGHESEATTQIYLASIEQGKVDEANKMILNSLHLFL